MRTLKLMPDGAVEGTVVEKEETVKQAVLETAPEHEKGLESGKTVAIEDDEKIVKYDDFAGKLPIPEKQKEEKAKEEKKDESPDDKKTTEIQGEQKKDDKKSEIPVIPTDKKEVKDDGKADISYDGFTEQQVKFLKQSSRQAREYFASEIRKGIEKETKVKEVEKQFEEFKKTGNAGLPQSYLEHQDAYVLNKDFQASVEVIQKASNELGFWEQQLVRVKNGEKWTDWVKQGDKLVQIERDPSAQAEIYLGNAIKRVEQVINSAEQKANQIKSGHIEIHKQSVAKIKELEDQHFPQFKDEEKCIGADKIKFMKGILGEMGQGSNVLSGGFSKMYTQLILAGEYIKSLEAKNAANEKKVETKKAVGPTSEDINGADRLGKPENKDEEVIKFSDFEKGLA